MATHSFDWEDMNKFAFVHMVQTALLSSTFDTDVRLRILFNAWRCKKACVPGNLYAAVKEFLDWIENRGTVPAPKWVEFPLDGAFESIA